MTAMLAGLLGEDGVLPPMIIPGPQPEALQELRATGVLIDEGLLKDPAPFVDWRISGPAPVDPAMVGGVMLRTGRSDRLKALVVAHLLDGVISHDGQEGEYVVCLRPDAAAA